MREFVGVKSPLDLMIEVASKRLPVESVFKREALMFRRIACPQLGNLVSGFEKLRGIAGPMADHFCAHIDYLKQRGVIFDDVASADGPELDVLKSDEEFRGLINTEELIGPWVLGTIQGNFAFILNNPNATFEELLPHVDQVPTIVGPLVVAFQLICRKLSVQLRLLNRMDAYPVFSEMFPPIPLQASAKSDVVEIAINALPLPDDTVPWE